MVYFCSSARILRASRVAGRLRFQFTRDTAHAIQDLAHSIVTLNRVLIETCAEISDCIDTSL